ncbi:MAG TPA: hypothetical protein VH500_13445 [Nitrososphaeraceae archaeon]|jgi:hypothetical protein
MYDVNNINEMDTLLIGLMIMIIVVIMPLIIVATPIYGQDNPCPNGKIPETDSNGDTVKDPDTGQIKCISGPE